MVYEYKTLLNLGEDEIIIEKSRFIAYAMPVENEQEAIDFINKIKLMHKNATHNCPAYVIGFNNEIQRYSDDKEPSGTAGIPILEVIKKEDLRNVALVVTRYFGGVKLGVGGLVRAYTAGAKLGIEAGKIIVKKQLQTIKIEIDYHILGKIQNDILQSGYIIKDIVYKETVDILVYVPFIEVDVFKKQALDWTSGRCQLTEGKIEYLAELDGKIIFS